MSASTLYGRPDAHTYLDAPLDAHQRAVVETLLRRLGLARGSRVAEVGAGSGRWTRALLDAGLEVIALEPDAVLAEKARRGLEGASGLRLVEAGAGGLPADAGPLDGLCGFHVLHHFDEAALRGLCRDIRAASRAEGFRGWFFVEPNPLNVLYPVQIGLHPGMRFREERGIWRRDYARLFAEAGVEFRVLGTIGRYPPQLARRLPQRWLESRRPRIGSRWSPAALYRVVGGGRTPA